MKSVYLNFLDTSLPLQACNWTDLPLYYNRRLISWRAGTIAYFSSFLAKVFMFSYSPDEEFHARVMKACFSLLLSVYCTHQTVVWQHFYSPKSRLGSDISTTLAIAPSFSASLRVAQLGITCSPTNYITLPLLFHRAFFIYLLICTNECTIFWLKFYTNISLLYNYTCSYMFRPLEGHLQGAQKVPY